nr:MAG TPA: hypothetical protein [Caudoviricetes sp.]
MSTHFHKTTARRVPFKSEKPVETDFGIVNLFLHLTGSDTMPTVQESDWPNHKHPSPPMREWWG